MTEELDKDALERELALIEEEIRVLVLAMLRDQKPLSKEAGEKMDALAQRMEIVLAQLDALDLAASKNPMH